MIPELNEDVLRQIDLNADAGESFGRWQLGNDEALIPELTSISIACGWHAGDPVTMQRSARLARENGVALGAHPGLQDMLGFGRRIIDAKPAELAAYCAYQVGALQGLAACEDAVVEHVKPHGALYKMASLNPAIAEEIARAVMAIDGSLILVFLDGSAAEAAERTGARVAREAFVDIRYDDDGGLILEPAVSPKDPAAVARRAVDIAHGFITTVSGKRLPVSADTICLHGDSPNAVEVARAVRGSLEAEGVSVVPLREIVSAREAVAP